jgi:hypothetical protein
VGFAAITICVASQVFVVVTAYFVISVWKLLDTPSFIINYNIINRYSDTHLPSDVNLVNTNIR